MSQSNNWKTASIALVGTVVVLAVVLGIIYFSQTIQSTGTIKTVGCQIYADAAGTQVVSTINWGILEPNTAVNMTLYLKNTGNVPENFTASTVNWVPANAQTYIALLVDFKGNAFNLQPNIIVPIVLSLSVNQNIPSSITNFSCATTIAGSG